MFIKTCIKRTYMYSTGTIIHKPPVQINLYKKYLIQLIYQYSSLKFLVATWIQQNETYCTLFKAFRMAPNIILLKSPSSSKLNYK